MSQFSNHPETALLHYIDFIDQGETEEQRLEFHYGSHEWRLLGDDYFAEEAFAKTEEKFQVRYSLDQIIMAVCDEYEIKPSMWAEPGRRRDVSEARAMAALLTLDADNLTLITYDSLSPGVVKSQLRLPVACKNGCQQIESWQLG